MVVELLKILTFNTYQKIKFDLWVQEKYFGTMYQKKNNVLLKTPEVIYWE